MLFIHHINTGPLCLIVSHRVLTTSPHSLPSSFLAWALHKLLKKKFFGHEKRPFELQQKMLSLQLAHSYYIDRTNHTNHITTEHKRLVGKVLPTLLCLPGFETQTQNDKTGKRSALQKGEVHERERGTGGGSENRRDLVCLRQALWTENRSMAAGGTLRSTEVVGD